MLHFQRDEFHRLGIFVFLAQNVLYIHNRYIAPADTFLKIIKGFYDTSSIFLPHIFTEEISFVRDIFLCNITNVIQHPKIICHITCEIEHEIIAFKKYLSLSKQFYLKATKGYKTVFTSTELRLCSDAF